MSVLYALFAVAALMLVAALGVGVAGWHWLFGMAVPYAAVATFVAGFVYRVVQWARSPAPFRIPTTCGQQKSLPWIRSSRLDNPHDLLGVVGRMALEILAFRSLFRNTKAELKEGPRLIYGSDKWLWAAGLAFHWSFLVIFIRHYRFFAEPTPSFVLMLQSLDGFFQIGLPIIYLSDMALVGALSFLFLRRVVSPQLRYLSLPADYFPLFLILSVAGTGMLMRYIPWFRVDAVAVKELAMGWISLHPASPQAIGLLFYIHLFLVCALAAYFPFSKLMHMAGVFLSPTRNLANNNRRRRHVNPWNCAVKTHTYEEWEDEYRQKMKDAGLPLEKE